MTRKYRLERTAFIGCRNTAYMDVDDAENGEPQRILLPYIARGLFERLLPVV